MAGVVVLGPAAMLMGSLGVAVLNVLLLWVGVQVFQRESILTRWR
jgi:ABC-type Na+ efflux pump permease subunit